MSFDPNNQTLEFESLVIERYHPDQDFSTIELNGGYAADSLEGIPQAALDHECGAGDPTPFIKEGDEVLDLGCGAGVGCMVAARKVGPEGMVIGIDSCKPLLEFARDQAADFGHHLGTRNVHFHYAKAHDLELNLELLDDYLGEKPITDAAGILDLELECARIRLEEPVVPPDSFDVVTANALLSLVRLSRRAEVIRDIYRALKPGGRVVICDVVSDSPMSPVHRLEPGPWVNCLSGALTLDELRIWLTAAGFESLGIATPEPTPWKKFQGVQLSCATVTAEKSAKAKTVAAAAAEAERSLTAVQGEKISAPNKGKDT